MKLKNRIFKCICKKCKNSFNSNSNTTLYCDNCLEQKICYECKNFTKELYLKFDNHIHICETCRKKYKRIFINICKCCDKEFFATSNRKLYCEKCLIKSNCNECGKEINEKLISKNNKNIYYCSKKCANTNKAKINSKSGNCIICKKYCKSRDALGQGVDCGCLEKHLNKKRENNKKAGKCVICGKYYESRDNLGRCQVCHKRWYKINNQLPQVRKAGNRNLKEFHYNQESNFKENNNCKIHSNEKLIYKGECWSCFKEKFIVANIKLYNFIKEIKILYEKNTIELIPTFRNQNSLDWNGARLAFEQSLLDKNISWFAYIKFYINKSNDVLPLVVGKSGSKLVNKNSDISFSKNTNDGPARIFLYEQNLEWDKTKILVISTKLEKEALNIEKELQDNYNLFGS